MDYVLDLDLDFLVWPIVHYPGGKQRLADEECKNLFSEDEVQHICTRNAFKIQYLISRHTNPHFAA